MRHFCKYLYLIFRNFFLYLLYIPFSYKKLSKTKPRAHIKRILFVRIDRIGDLILSTPAIKAIKQTYPSSELIALLSKSNQAILKNNPYVDDTIIYNNQRGFFKILSLIRRLRGYRFDLAIDPYTDYEIKTALITFLSGAKERVGFISYGRQVFFNYQVPKAIEKKHFVDLTLDVLSPLNVDIKDKSPQVYFTEFELEWSKSWIKQNLFGKKPILGIHPGAFYESQRWLLDYFAELINRLQENHEFEIIMFGGPDDKILIERIDSLTQIKPIKFISENLRQFIALLSYCNILICNNSGPLQIAVATKTPTISFMGPTVKESWKPLGDIHKVLRVDNLPCIGCNSGVCKINTHDCMNLITPSEVLKTIYSKIDNSFNIDVTSILSL